MLCNSTYLSPLYGPESSSNSVPLNGQYSQRSSSDLLCVFLRVSILFHGCISYTLYTHRVRCSLFLSLYHRPTFQIFHTLILKLFRNKGKKNFKKIIKRKIIVTVVLAEAIPELGLFISLVGAVSSTALALLFPPIIELVVCWQNANLSPFMVIKDVTIVLIGLLGFATGTYESITSIIKAFDK